MRQRGFIQKSIAYFLLLVFAVSVTPRIAFHEVLAEHRDGAVCQDTDQSAPHFHLPSFHCDFNDLVVASPYLLSELKLAPAVPVYYCRPIPDYAAAILTSPTCYIDTRGPPAA